jgi:hypothetical protein
VPSHRTSLLRSGSQQVKSQIQGGNLPPRQQPRVVCHGPPSNRPASHLSSAKLYLPSPRKLSQKNPRGAADGSIQVAWGWPKRRGLRPSGSLSPAVENQSSSLNCKNQQTVSRCGGAKSYDLARLLGRFDRVPRCLVSMCPVAHGKAWGSPSINVGVTANSPSHSFSILHAADRDRNLRNRVLELRWVGSARALSLSSQTPYCCTEAERIMQNTPGRRDQVGIEAWINPEIE